MTQRWSLASPTQTGTASLWSMATLEVVPHFFFISLVIFFFFFFCWAWHYMIWNIPLFKSSQLSQLSPLPASFPILSLLIWEWEQKNAVQALFSNSQNTSVLIKSGLAASTKHSVIWAAMMEVNSFPDRHSTSAFENVLYIIASVILTCLCSTNVHWILHGESNILLY